MLIPFFTFVLFLIIVLIMGAVSDSDSAPKKTNINGIITTPVIDKIVKTELDKREKADILKEQIKNIPTELKPKPISKLDIEKTPLEKNNILPSGVIK